MITLIERHKSARISLTKASYDQFDDALIPLQVIEAEMAALLDMKPEAISLMDAVEIEALASRGAEL